MDRPALDKAEGVGNIKHFQKFKVGVFHIENLFRSQKEPCLVWRASVYFRIRSVYFRECSS